MWGKTWLTKGFMCLTLLLALAPLPLLLAVAAGARPLSVILLPYALSMVLTALAGLSFPNRRLPAGLTAVALSLAALFVLARHIGFGSLWTGAYALVLIAACAVMLRITSLPAGQELGGQHLFLAGGLHLLAVLLSRLEGMAAAGVWLSFATPLYFLCVMLIVNRLTLTDGVALRKSAKPPSRILWRNRVLLGVFALAVLLVVNLHRVRDAVYWVAGKVAELVLWIMWLISSLYPGGDSAGGGEGGGGMDLSALGEASEPGWFALLMEQVFKVLALILLVILVGFGLWKVGKMLWKLFLRLKARFAQYAASLGDSYVDEAESVFDWGELTRAAGDRLQTLLDRARARRPKWSQMDNRQRMRYAYQYLLRKRPNVPDAKTARSALLGGDLPLGKADAKAFADAYDAARYSVAPITDEAADNARRALE